MNVVVYTDASCDDRTGISCVGFLVVRGTEIIKHEIALYENTGGCYKAEHMAVTLALQYCFLLDGVKRITVFTEILAIIYKVFWFKLHPVFKELRETIDIIDEHGISVKLRKVNAHSHDWYNDIIDRSVRQGLRDYLKEISSNGKEAIPTNA